MLLVSRRHFFLIHGGNRQEKEKGDDFELKIWDGKLGLIRRAGLPLTN
jgi:hypothetical protein